MENPILTFAIIALIMLGASYIQSVTGFGFGIFAMIFLPSLLSYTESNALSTILSAITSVYITFLMRRHISWKNMIFPLLGYVVSSVFSVIFIKTQTNDTLLLLLGVALFVLSVYFFFFSSKIKIKPSWYAGLIAGLISGVMGGMFAMSGPPVVIYFMQSEKSADRYLGTISAYFVVSGIISIVTKAAAGFVTTSVLFGVCIGAMGMAAGAVLGKISREKTKPEYIKRAVYGVMAISGIVNIVTAMI